MFEQTLLVKPRRNPWATLLSFAVDGLLLAALVLAPLIFTEVLPQIMRAVEIGPPPACEPAAAERPPAAEPRRAPEPQQTNFADDGRLIAPPKIPTTIVHVVDLAPEPGFLSSARGVIGSLPGGSGGNSDVIRVLADMKPAPAPPPPPPEPTTRRVFVGGNVQQARAIFQPDPIYPVIAIQARVSGTVRLAAWISEQGAIEELRVVEGHPLLIAAAVQAVRQWRYRPLVLNGVPQKVETTIDVHFRLN